MPNHVLDLRLFRYAVVSAEHGSFRRAAAALNVQQSTVSRGIRNLEHRLGAKLFERSHAGVRPTLAGDRFLQDATLGFDRLERAMQRVGAMQRGEQGELIIGASVLLALLGDLFERFRNEYRNVSVEIVESTCSASCASVQRRKLDIAFVTKVPSGGTLRSFHLRDERMIVVLPQSHRLAGARALMLEELCAEHIILSAGGLGPEIAAHLTRRTAKSGAEPNIHLHRAGQCNLVNMVARGFGATICVGQLPCSASDGVVLVPLAGRNVVSVHAVWMESNPNPALGGLLKIIQGSSWLTLSD